jgi:hypothetical protein
MSELILIREANQSKVQQHEAEGDALVALPVLAAVD